MKSFEEFSLDPAILDALRDLNYEKATPIQAEAIPLILQGEDLIGLAETGSGKTAACAIPVCHRVNIQNAHIQALVVVPTRELALQYSLETQKIGRVKKVKAFALFGGEDMDLQRAKLKDGVHVLIATPGRLIDFIFSRAIDLTGVETLILDEADQMLGMGFFEDLEFIMQCLVQDHQTLLFSATMPTEIHKIAKAHMRAPKEVVLTSKKPTPTNLAHQFFFARNPREKAGDLLTLLKKISPGQCLIFANSRNEVHDVHRFLKRHLSSIDFLHGGLDQSVRMTIMQKFMKGKIRFLIATDVASRGLDFTHVTHVFNLHLPRDLETYFHRSGRTARSGRSGVSLTLVSQRELAKLRALIKALKKEPEWIGKAPKDF